MFRAVLGAALTLLLVSAGFFFSALAAGGATTASSLLAYGGLFLASVATFTGVYFGWRKDRREAKKYKLEIEVLEAQKKLRDD